MLKDIFAQNKDIVINTDIDGFLCGMILQKHYGCRVVGFSNSRETVWLIPEIEDINKPIYIDLYVANPAVTCIEQHIIAYDKRSAHLAPKSIRISTEKERLSEIWRVTIITNTHSVPFTTLLL